MYSRKLGLKTKKSLSKVVGKRKAKIQSEELNLPMMVANRDWSGAAAYLEFFQQEEKESKDNYDTLPWLAYCYFHWGKFSKAMKIYQKLLTDRGEKKYHLYIACCFFFLGLYLEAKNEGARGPDCALKNRILIHSYHKLGMKKEVDSIMIIMNKNFTNSVSEQGENAFLGMLTIAALQYERSEFQQALDIFKKLIISNQDFLAIHIYMGMCYHKFKYYDISNEVVKVYLTKFPKSIIGNNLKAVNDAEEINFKTAEEQLEKLLDEQNSYGYHADNVLIQHNKCVFSGGEDALKTFPQLLDSIPESKLNLAMFYLKNDQPDKAFELMKDHHSVADHREVMIKAACYALVGREKNSKKHLKMATDHFDLVGLSETHSNTVPGRKCTACSQIIQNAFEDAVVYLESFQDFYKDNRTEGSPNSFFWNLGIAHCETGEFEKAQKSFERIKDPKLIKSPTYISYFTRCLIYNGNVGLAWDLYLNHDLGEYTRDLLLLIGNDCYLTGRFLYAAKAFDVLERLEKNNPSYFVAKKGAVVGAFQQTIAGQREKGVISELVKILSKSHNKEASAIVRRMSQYFVAQKTPKSPNHEKE